MPTTPRWFRPIAIVALIWNLLGCAAYLADVTLTPEDIAKLPPAQQELYAARPSWAVAATATAVWGGAAGCLGLILRKRWSYPLLAVSLAAVIVQDVALFGMTEVVSTSGPTVVVLQGLVLVVAIALVMLARTAVRREWVS
jgi:hypothetical protein